MFNNISLRIFLVLVVLTGGIALLLQYLPSRHVRLPAPTGIYDVGTTFLAFKDSNRIERHNPPHKRELAVQAWYPIKKQMDGQQPLSYLGPSIAYVKKAIAELKGINVKQFAYLDSIKTHSYSDVSCCTDGQSFPVLLFSPGFGAPQEAYTSILEDLASHGYIVFGINHPYVSNPTIFPDGRIILPSPLLKKLDTPESKQMASEEFRVWLEDIHYLINELKTVNIEHALLRGALRLNKIGIIGHSFGGRAALEICRDNELVSMGIDLDGKLTADNSLVGINKPFLFMVAERKDATGLKNIKIVQSASGGNVSLITLLGAEHGSFSDLNYVFEPWLRTSSLDPLKAIEIIRKVVVAYCDEYLKGRSHIFDRTIQKLAEQKWVRIEML